MQRLILLQGPPGAGKSTRARQLVAAYPPARLCSTDDFHIGEDGAYHFDRENLAYYHAWNQYEVYQWLLDGWNVIVDNCNIRRVHARPYLEMARRMGVFVQVVRCTGAYKSIHAVPPEVVLRMLVEMEDLLG